MKTMKVFNVLDLVRGNAVLRGDINVLFEGKGNGSYRIMSLDELEENYNCDYYTDADAYVGWGFIELMSTFVDSSCEQFILLLEW